MTEDQYTVYMVCIVNMVNETIQRTVHSAHGCIVNMVNGIDGQLKYLLVEEMSSLRVIRAILGKIIAYCAITRF